MATYNSILENLDTSPIHLTTKQQHLLSLLDQISETRLSIALLEAHDSTTTSSAAIQSTQSPTPADIKQAEQAVLSARARYTLRERIVTQTLIVDPILKAVHYDDDDNDEEQQTKMLVPLIHELKRAIHSRDVLAMLQGTINTELSSTQQRIRLAERENKYLNARNAEMAQRVVALANQLREPRTEDVEDDEMRKQLEKADEEVAQARRRWRVMKSLTAGVVVGSGVRWADDERLTELVLDDEDELR